MNQVSVFNDTNESGFGLGKDQRKSTITYAQAMEVMRVLNNLSIYGEIFVNPEGVFTPGEYLPVDPTDTAERVYVLHYNAGYHELAEIAVWLDKTPKTEVVRRVYQILGMYDANIINIPAVRNALNEALAKLF